MSEMLPDKKVAVLADGHEQYELIARAIDSYEQAPKELRPDVMVSAGDIITGEQGNLAKTLDLVQKADIDIELVKGNQEFLFLAGVLSKDREFRDRLRYGTKPFKMAQLKSYATQYDLGNDINRDSRSELVDAIVEKMQERGHLQLLVRAAMYYEGRDFIAVHAGMTDEGWLLQKQNLFYANRALIQGEKFDVPPQLFDFALARQSEAFKATHKTVVTGHDHYSKVTGGITAGGKRVRLASRLVLNDPLHVWQSWNGKVREFSQK